MCTPEVPASISAIDMPLHKMAIANKQSIDSAEGTVVRKGWIGYPLLITIYLP